MAKKNKSGRAKTIAALVLSVIMLVGGVVVGYGWGTDWKYKKGVQATMPDDGAEINNSANPMQLSKLETRGTKFNARALAKEEYQEYEIATQNLDSVHVATVTLANHKDATDKSLTLTVEFTDAAASNLNASDYIQLSATTVQSGEEFTITCLQAFPYPITIKATANGSVSAADGSKAYCSIRADYVRRIKKIDLVLGTSSDRSDDRTLLYYFNYCITMGTEANNNLKTEIDADTEGAVWKATGSQDGLNVIYIESPENKDGYLSAGTISEGIRDVKIKIEDSTDPAPNWGSVQTIDNGLDDVKIYIDHGEYDACYDNPLFLNSSSQNSNVPFLSSLDSCLMTNAGDDYYSVLNFYNKNQVTSTIYVQFTGEQTGIMYTFSAGLIVNPRYMYIPASNPSFDPDTSGGIIF